MTERDTAGRFARGTLSIVKQHRSRKHGALLGALGVDTGTPVAPDADLVAAQTERATAEAKLEAAEAHAELAALRAQQS